MKSDNPIDGILLTVRKTMPGADSDTVRTVAALAGLLAAVAYADGHFSSPEHAHVRDVLSQVKGLGATGVDAICTVLMERAAEASTVHMYGLARELRELTDRDTRLEILNMLVDLAAADDVLSLSETNYLRQLASSLGLSPADYNASQARHRAKLSVLK